ncbi:XdhC family protein [Streptacidiphilus sp. N1-12]|uniref:XdhC family protein n=2 Tax=Streptacidiphilus alkalitolerans TaxID=3342712 RepID=A0ABV6V3G4_9ACTN
MLDISSELDQWCAQERDFALATVVRVSGSAPREAGAALAVDSAGTAIGSVSGGCVEGSVYEQCQQALTTRRSSLEHYGYSADDAFAVGLSCGGELDILVSPVVAGSELHSLLCEALALVRAGEAAALTRVVAGPAELVGRAMLVRPDGSYRGRLGEPGLDRTAAAQSLALIQTGGTGIVELGAEGSHCGEPVTLLVETNTRPPRMIIFGAVDFAAALSRIGGYLGFDVTVCDARPVFATPARFPEADRVVVDWPHRYLAAEAEAGRLDGRTALCVLTHDAKFDIPLLEHALRLPVAYVGAMGSRRTHAEREDRLRRAGLDESEIARLRSPIGLDLGSRTPQETALSIAAEIVADRYQATGVRLGDTGRPIHRPQRLALGLGSV